MSHSDDVKEETNLNLIQECDDVTNRMQQQIKKYHYKSPKIPQKKYDGQNLQSLIYHKKWDQCISRITSHPHETKLVDKLSGDLALHEACQSGAPFNVIQHLIHTNQSALSTRGFCGRIPLHYAVYVRPTVNVIKLLLRYYKDGAAVFDNDGRLPIHMAVLRNAPNLVIQVLIDANLRGLISCNKFGNTPDMICNNDLVKALLKDEKQKKDSHLNQKEEKIRHESNGSKGLLQGTTIEISKNQKDDTVCLTKTNDINEPKTVPLQDVTVTGDYNRMKTKDGYHEITTSHHGSIHGDVGTARPQPPKLKNNPIVPTKSTNYRLMDNNNRIQYRRNYEIPSTEQLIARQFSLSGEDDDANS